MNVQRILRSKWLSSGLIVAGLFLLGLSYYQQISQEIWYWWKDQQGTYITVDPTLPDANNKVVTIEPKSTDFGLVIEKIGVNEPIAADVDPFNQNEYLSILEQTPVPDANLIQPRRRTRKPSESQSGNKPTGPIVTEEKESKAGKSPSKSAEETTSTQDIPTMPTFFSSTVGKKSDSPIPPRPDADKA